LGNEHSETASSLNNLANVLSLQNKQAEAEVRYRESLAIDRKLWPNGHPHIARTLVSLGHVLDERGQSQDAENYIREGLDMSRKLLGNDHPDVASALGWLVDALAYRGKLREAEPLAREYLHFFEKRDPESYWAFSARFMLGANLMGQMKFADAEPLLISGYEGMARTKGKIESSSAYGPQIRLKDTLELLVALHEVTGRPNQAAVWKQKLAELEKAETTPKPEAP
jgi:tetratricopeptide (TPR) repeat protein